MSLRHTESEKHYGEEAPTFRVKQPTTVNLTHEISTMLQHGGTVQHIPNSARFSGLLKTGKPARSPLG